MCVRNPRPGVEGLGGRAHASGTLDLLAYIPATAIFSATGLTREVGPEKKNSKGSAAGDDKFSVPVLLDGFLLVFLPRFIAPTIVISFCRQKRFITGPVIKSLNFYTDHMRRRRRRLFYY